MAPSHENLSHLVNSELHQHTVQLAAKERECTTEILHSLAEVEKRRLFAERGFSSLFAYCTEALGYSESGAQRRISAMRLVRQLPAVEAKIAEGVLHLSAVSKAQSFFVQEAKNDHPLSLASKLEVLTQLEGKSSRKCDQELAARSSLPEPKIKDKIQPVSETNSEIRFMAAEELVEMIEQIRGLLAHKNPKMNLGELFLEMARLSLEQLTREKMKTLKKDKQKKAVSETETVGAGAHSAPPTSAVNPASRHIPRAVQREVYERDGMYCTYVDPTTGRKCCSQFALELDHIEPFARGGASTAENLTVRCKQHNAFHAAQSFGDAFSKYSKEKTDPSAFL